MNAQYRDDYPRRSVGFWILLYVLIGIIVYLLIYYLAVGSRNDQVTPYSSATATTQETQTIQATRTITAPIN